MSTSAAITLDNVSKTFRIYHEVNRSLKAAVLNRSRARYEEFWALTDVSLEIPQGETFGLLGNNGSGKSTLLKCIARILEPNRGSITHRGRLAAMLEVGSGFHPELSGRENVYLNGSILGMSRAEIDGKFDSIVDFSGVEAFIDQPVKNYSSGMYVRLGFAVAIHVEPDILLVDEVLAVGDMQFQEKCMEKFADFKREGRTVVVVSHALDQMRSFCDSAVWLQKGKIQGMGPANDIISAYSDTGHNVRVVEGGGTRYGSGEAVITKVEMLHPTVGDTRDFRTGDRVTIRLHYHADTPLRRPVFGVTVEHVDGLHLWGHQTSDSQYRPEQIDPGDGSIDITIPRITLRANAFFLNASIQAERSSRVIDSLQRAVRFDVHDGVPFESSGWLTLDATWENLQPPQPLQ